MNVPAPARLSEREAIDTLRVIAALHGGQVHELGRVIKALNAKVGFGFNIEKIGFAIYAVDMAAPLDATPRWVWTREDGVLAWRPTRELQIASDTIYACLPLGRIDRGLGAIP